MKLTLTNPRRSICIETKPPSFLKIFLHIIIWYKVFLIQIICTQLHCLTYSFRILFWRLLRNAKYSGISIFVGYLKPNIFLYKLLVLFKKYQYILSTQFNCQKHFYFKQFNLLKQFLIQTTQLILSTFFKTSKIVLFLIIQFCISMQLSSIWLIDRTLSGATTPGQNGPVSNSNEEVLRFVQSSSITGTSSSDFFVSYQDTRCGGITPLQRSSQCILQPQPSGQQ